MVLMHNDAVVQGLSEVPFMQDVRRWGILTIGTGLGIAAALVKQSTRASLLDYFPAQNCALAIVGQL